MKIAVLFDGAGGARLGLEQAGHECIGVELDKNKHYLSQFVGSGKCILGDATQFDVGPYDAIWASPPCQLRSSANNTGRTISQYGTNYLDWCLSLIQKYPDKVIWIENVVIQGKKGNEWGKIWNAAQFLKTPIQNRNRVIGGRYKDPKVFHPWKKTFKGICPCITASEYKGCASDTRRASRFYGRRLTINECAYHQGLNINPKSGWKDTQPSWFTGTEGEWRKELYTAIGNMVPPYMAKAFGEVY